MMLLTPPPPHPVGARASNQLAAIRLRSHPAGPLSDEWTAVRTNDCCFPLVRSAPFYFILAS
jgi:hypothetical protein